MTTDERKKSRWLEGHQKANLIYRTNDDLIDILYYQCERLDCYEKTLKSILNKTTKALK